MKLSTDLYKKDWFAQHPDGSFFYMGDLEQGSFELMSGNGKIIPTLSLVENIEEDEEFEVCLSSISSGTEFRLRAIRVIMFPFREGN